MSVSPAAETTVTTTETVATAATSAGPTTRDLTTAVEAAAPSAGADLAMWGLGNETSTAGEPGAGPSPVRRLANGIIARSTSIAMNLTRHAMRFLGVPCVFGGTSTSGFDCSGFVQHVFAMLGVRLPRTADAQFSVGRKVGGSMAPGDLVFFTTYESGPSHVGIYLGDGRFVHASSSHGVTVSRLGDRYWAARYLGAKRMI